MMNNTYYEGHEQLKHIMKQNEPSAIYDRRFRDPNEESVMMSPHRPMHNDYFKNMAPVELGPIR